MINTTINVRILAVLILILTISAIPIANAANAPTAVEHFQQGDSTPPSTEETIAQTIVPERDLIDLARRLGGVQNIPAPPTTPVRIYQTGDVDSFFVHTDNRVITVDATMVYANDVVYMWIENGYSVDMEAVRYVADRFASDIYDPLRDVFGSEANPGIDGDPRIHILNSTQLGRSVAGYFYSLHQAPIQAIEVSNEREMYFAAVDLLERNPDYFLSIFAHEFEHMIHFAVDSNETSWLDEGLAELAAYIAGYGVSGWYSTYLARPELQLNNWPDGDTGPIYGGSFLFNLYLSERFGTDFIRALVASPANGMASITRVLAEQGLTDTLTGLPLTAEDVYRDWSVANLLNNISVADGQYGYREPVLQSDTVDDALRRVQRLRDTLQGTVNQYGTVYYRVPASAFSSQQLTIDFSGDESGQLLPVNAVSGAYALWSNRANLSNPRLTHAFDLSNTSRATLSFDIWYEIEDNYDNAYLSVSVDDGQTWELLQTARTTTADPFGTSYGNAYTGSSNGWGTEIVDLSRFAGQQILVRWEYVTDDAVLGNGMLIDNVSIPEIDFFDDLESRSEGWIVEGWLLTNNVLQQHYSVTMIERLQNGDARVTPLLTASGSTTLNQTVNVGTDIQDVVIAISAYAPITVQSANFTLSLSTN